MKLLSLTSLLFALVLCLPPDGHAATIVVTNINDDGPGSLRQAVAQSNSTEEPDTIVFDAAVFSVPRTIVLTSGEITTTHSVAIEGPGADLLTISGNDRSRIFYNNFSNNILTLRKLTLTRGFAAMGGAISSNNRLVLSDLVITGNTAAGAAVSQAGPYFAMGGGIFSTGQLLITDSVISNNQALGIVMPSTNPSFGDGVSAGAGGGIYGYGFNTMVVNCHFAGNIAKGANAPDASGSAIGSDGGGGYGGAIYIHGNFKLVNSTFVGNAAVGGSGAFGSSGGDGGHARGGAIHSSDAFILNSLFHKNSARAGNGAAAVNPDNAGNGGPASGGALYDLNLKVANLTIADNTVVAGTGRTGGNGGGGGLYLGRGHQWSILNSTITGNTAVGGSGTLVNGMGEGGGIYGIAVTPPVPSFRNNIVSGNEAPSGKDLFGNFVNAFNNLISVVDGSTGIANGVNGNIVGSSSAPVDPLLGPIANNGGLTQTRSLLPGSPAIDAGNNSIFNPITSQLLHIDQRNFQRQVGPSIDIGAYESGADTVPVPLAPDLRAASDSGVSNSDDHTSARSVMFDISNVIPGATVELLKDNMVAATTRTSDFLVSLTDASPPLDGGVQYSVRQTIGGVSSQASGTLVVTFDNTAPTVTIDRAATQPDPATKQPVLFTVVFSEPVIVFDRQDISFAGSTADLSTASVWVNYLGANTYSVEVMSIRSPGSIVVTIPANAAVDRVNLPTSAAASVDNTVIFNPPAFPVSVSGRVRRTSGVLRGTITIVLTDLFTGEQFSGLTNPFGYFTISGITAYQGTPGRRFTVSIRNKSFALDPFQPVTVAGDVSNLNYSVP